MVGGAFICPGNYTRRYRTTDSDSAFRPTPTATLTPTLSPTPYYYLAVGVERLLVYTGPAETYDVWGEVRRGDQLSLRGRSEDGMWWQVDYLGWKGWIRAQAVGANVEPTILPVSTPPSTPTITPTPPETVTPTLPAHTEIPSAKPGL